VVVLILVDRVDFHLAQLLRVLLLVDEVSGVVGDDDVGELFGLKLFKERKLTETTYF
jgi:hypothetical protein